MKVENVKVYDLEESIKASKYPMSTDTESLNSDITERIKGLASSPKGSGHDQFLTGIRVAFDLTCTNKMWVEMERYRFVEFVSSQSTMHRIISMDIRSQCDKHVLQSTIYSLESMVEQYNNLSEREKANVFGKELYLTILYNIPVGLNLTARLTTNYRALKAVYSQRKDHRLLEWRDFCEWIKTLPYAEQLICFEG